MRIPLPRIDQEILSFHAAALILGGAAFLSRLLGLARDRLLASQFGAGETLDIYYAAFQIPDVFYTVLLIGAASAAVLPVFLEREQEGVEAAERFIGNILTLFFVIGSVLAIIVGMFMPRIVAFVAPGFDAPALERVAYLSRIILPNAVFLGIAGILSSVLQARHRFIAFALPPIFYNLAIIAGVIFLAPRFGDAGLALGVLIGGILEVLVLLPAFFDLGFRFRPGFALGDSSVRRVFRTALPRVLALSMSQIVLVALAAIASFFTAGSIAVFKFASNLLYVPVGLFGVSYALAAFPKLSRSYLAGEGGEFVTQLAAGIRTVFFWALPIATLAIVLRAHIVRVVLGTGAFDWEDTRLVAACLAIFSVAIITESVLPMVLRAFYALGETRRPLIWDITGSLLTVCSALGFSWYFVEQPQTLQLVAQALRIDDLPAPEIIGVALGFSFGSAANLFMLLLSLRRATRERLGARLSIERMSIAIMLGAAVLAGVAAYLALIPFPVLIPTNTLPGIFAQGLAAGVAGILVYILILWTQRNPELGALISSLRGRLYFPGRTPEIFETEKVDGETH